MKIAHIYTDGSSTPVKGGGKGHGGWAFVVVKSPKSKDTIAKRYGHNKKSTNNSMELTAVINSLHYCNTNLTTKKVVIYTDSKYVSDSIYFDFVSDWEANGWVNSAGKPTANIDEWIELTDIIKILTKRQVDVEVRWVRGHNGNRFNERADRLAKKGKKNKKINKDYE